MTLPSSHTLCLQHLDAPTTEVTPVKRQLSICIDTLVQLALDIVHSLCSLPTIWSTTLNALGSSFYYNVFQISASTNMVLIDEPFC